jgi:hypothetical protein
MVSRSVGLVVPYAEGEIGGFLTTPRQWIPFVPCCVSRRGYMAHRLVAAGGTTAGELSSASKGHVSGGIVALEALLFCCF